jgi:hypothetical protein
MVSGDAARRPSMPKLRGKVREKVKYSIKGVSGVKATKRWTSWPVKVNIQNGMITAFGHCCRNEDILQRQPLDKIAW